MFLVWQQWTINQVLPNKSQLECNNMVAYTSPTCTTVEPLAKDTPEMRASPLIKTLYVVPVTERGIQNHPWIEDTSHKQDTLCGLKCVHNRGSYDSIMNDSVTMGKSHSNSKLLTTMRIWLANGYYGNGCMLLYLFSTIFSSLPCSLNFCNSIYTCDSGTEFLWKPFCNIE